MIGLLIILLLIHANVTHIFSTGSTNAYLQLVVLCILVAYIVTTFVRRNNFYLNVTFLDVLLLLYFIISIVNAQWIGTGLLNDEIINLALSLLMYLVIRTSHVVLTTKHEMYFFIVTSVIVLMEFTHCSLQYFQVITNTNPFYSIGGSFGHPAFTAGTLAVLTPFILHQLVVAKLRIMRIVALFILILFGIILVVLNSRAAMIASLFGSAVFLSMHFKGDLFYFRFLWSRSKIYSGLVFSILLLITTIFFFVYKANSSYGRVFIWKKCMALVTDYPLKGVGTGNFRKYYNAYQADYFQRGSGSVQERIQAEYVETAYNDYIEVAVERGVIVVLLLMVIIWFSFRIERSAFSKQREYIPFYASLIAFLPLSLGWTVFKFLPFIFYFLALAAILQSLCSKFVIKRIESKVLLLTIFFCLYILASYSTTVDVISFVFYQKGTQHFYQDREFDHAAQAYEKAYTVSKRNRELNLSYSQALLQTRQFEKASRLLNEVSNDLNSPIVLVALGESYELQKKYADAEAAYLRAYFTTPSRLYPLFLLSKLYYKTDHLDKADSVARVVVGAEAKVNSLEVRLIKEDAKRFLKKGI